MVKSFKIDVLGDGEPSVSIGTRPSTTEYILELVHHALFSSFFEFVCIQLFKNEMISRISGKR